MQLIWDIFLSYILNMKILYFCGDISRNVKTFYVSNAAIVKDACEKLIKKKERKKWERVAWCESGGGGDNLEMSPL